MHLQFEPIQLEKQREYAEMLARCSQVASDYSFLNLWAWAQDYGLCWAWEHDLVWIKQTRPEVFFWAPIGAWETVDWKAKFDASRNAQTAFIRIPENLTARWRQSLENRPVVREDRGHWDYIYAVVDLIELKGNRYHKKKNLLNQFQNRYAHTYTALGPDLIEHAMDMQTAWCMWRDCESFDILSAENRAILRILQNWDRLDGAMGAALMMEQTMIAYTVAEALTADTVLIHFEKGDTEYKGVYQAMNQLFLAHSAKDFQFVNREQDLNDEGLRKAKQSYLPVDFIRKYRVTLPGLIIS